MSIPIGATTPFEPAEAKRWLDQFAVSQASELALAGHYDSAESLLKELAQRPDAPPAALDLLARICVQQGRVLEAGAYWRRALDGDPANAAYQAAWVRLNRLQRRPVWLTLLWPAVLALVVVIFGLLAMQVQSRRHQAEVVRLEGLIRQASDLTAKSSEINRLDQSMEALRAQQAAAQVQMEQTRRELRRLAASSAGVAKALKTLLDAQAGPNSLDRKNLPVAHGQP